MALVEFIDPRKIKFVDLIEGKKGKRKKIKDHRAHHNEVRAFHQFDPEDDITCWENFCG